MKKPPSDPPAKTSGAPRARYIMIGGFLGAGKTTAVGKLARWLTGQGLRVGLITNDQGRNLVDTAMLRAQGFATEEIPGGCFCCRFNSLVEASSRLSAAAHPDVFIAEPVGSCTDLVATVTYPLRRLHGENFLVAPVSVLVDPIRALRILGIELGGGFSEKVAYIYKKQLEEADIIVINKSDLPGPERVETLRRGLAARYPQAEILAVSARDGSNLDGWFARITGERQAGRAVMQVDYEVYADGEALMGWLNATVQITAAQPIDADALLEQLAREIQRGLQAGRAEIAHLKMTFSPDGKGPAGVASLSLVRSDFVPELGMRLESPAGSGQLIINLRAEASPDLLAATVKAALPAVAARFPVAAQLDHLEHFRPGKPNPTHRDAAAAPGASDANPMDPRP